MLNLIWLALTIYTLRLALGLHSLRRSWAGLPPPVTPLDRFHVSVRRWGYVGIARGRE